MPSDFQSSSSRAPRSREFAERCTVIYGPPGTGKTHRLLELLEEELQTRDPETVAFVTFTRAASREARDRATYKFGYFGDELCWFRTIHSTAYRLLKIPKELVLDDLQWKAFAEAHGYDLTPLDRDGTEADPFNLPRLTDDDRVRFVIEWSRSRMLDVENGISACPVDCAAGAVRLFWRRYSKFKRSNYLWDFSDLLERTLQLARRPHVQIAFIDEAQDLSPLQIAVVELWFHDCETIYVAGDDDQAVYGWSGADPSWLVGLFETASASQILDRSYRIPRCVHEVATQIIAQNRQRVSKDYRPQDCHGLISRMDRLQALDAICSADDSVLVLARNRFFLRPWVAELVERNAWFVAEGRRAEHRYGDQVREAVNTASALRRGDPVSPKGLSEMLQLVKSRGPAGLPHGIKTKIARHAEAIDKGQLLAPDDLMDNWGLDRLLRRLEEVGEVEVLDALPVHVRRRLAQLLEHHDGSIPEAVVRLTTIHGAKGREADTVVVVPDMTRASYAEYQNSERAGFESENRVAYVAVTRAKNHLILIEPTTRRYFPYTSFITRGRDLGDSAMSVAARDRR